MATLELQAKSMAQKIVREKVEEHKQKELVKHRKLAASERALNKMSNESASRL